MKLLTAIPNATFGYMEHTMRVASEVILNISIEQECIGPVWPHPWDHYPFITSGRYVWLRYHDLDCGQRDQITNAVERVKNRLSQHSSTVKANMPYVTGNDPK